MDYYYIWTSIFALIINFSNLGRYLLIWSTLDYNSHHNKNDASRKVTIYKRVSLFPSMNYWKSFTRQIKNKPFAKGLLICDNSCLFNSFFIKWKETTFYQLSLLYRKISHLSKVIWNTSSFGLLPCIINVEPIPKVGIVLKYSSFEVFDSNRSPLIMYLLPKLQSVVKSIKVVYYVGGIIRPLGVFTDFNRSSWTLETLRPSSWCKTIHKYVPLTSNNLKMERLIEDKDFDGRYFQIAANS